MMCVCGELTRRYKYFEFLAREDPSHQSTLEPRHEAKMKKIICMQSDCLLLHMYVLPHISEMPSLYPLCCNSMNGRTDELDSLSSLDISVERWPYDERRGRKKINQISMEMNLRTFTIHKAHRFRRVYLRPIWMAQGGFYKDVWASLPTLFCN